MITAKKRIWGWMAFDWASQPYYTLGLTFIFGPYFASVATQYLLGTGLEAGVAKAQAQSIWSTGQVVSGLFIALTAPFLGAYADHSGRKIPWIATRAPDSLTLSPPFAPCVYTFSGWQVSRCDCQSPHNGRTHCSGG